MLNKSLAIKILIPIGLLLVLFTFVKASPIGENQSNIFVTQGVITIDGDFYYNPKCRFCRRVLSYLDQNHIKIENMKNIITEPRYKSELKKYNLATVPVLIINSKPLVGDKEIIAYLEETTERSKNK